MPRIHLSIGIAGAAIVCLAGVGSVAVPIPPTGTTSSARTVVTETERPATTASNARVQSRLAAFERRRGARLGLMAIDTGTGKTVGHRANERFAFASTIKVALAAVVMDQLSARDLEQRLFWSEEDLVDHSPITELYVDDGMTVRQLIDAAMTLSDNTATNLLFDLVGGPQAVEDRLA